MFVDKVTLKLQAGAGGSGKVAFFPNKGGPSGGNGGRGGDVYARVDPQCFDLSKYASFSHMTAEAGRPGEKNRRSGRAGENVIIDVPRGTTVYDLKTHEEFELNDTDSMILLCVGGEGGLGNDTLKGPENRTPKFAELGKKGQRRNVTIILRLIADYGLIGMPNAGKSTLLNELTAAHAQIANYPFTTLEPNLGVLDSRVIADIPGLIEGASEGRGLGIKFLKHIEKVKLLIHCISSESNDVIRDYKTVINEMSKHDKKLAKKDFIVLLTKIDLIEKTEVAQKVKELKQFSKDIYPISVLDPQSIQKLRKKLASLIA